MVTAERFCPAVMPKGCWVTTTLVAAAGEIVRLSDWAPVKPVSLTPKVKLPLSLIDRSLKVATPAWAATVFVPLSTPVPVAIATVTFDVLAATTLPNWSSTETIKEDRVCPAMSAAVGCVITNCDGASGVMSKLLEMADPKVPEVTCSVYDPAVVKARPSSVATPF